MYPGVIVEYNDQSDIPVTLPVTEVRNQPLFAAVFSADKGPEDWTKVSGKEFFELYGNSISFTRHGQPLLQAAMTINAGAELLCKRLVAHDATLANIGIFVKITDATETVKIQATDDDGKAIYVDAEGNETTEATTDGVANTPKMVDSSQTVKKITYSTKSVTNAIDAETAKAELLNLATDGELLLYVIVDNGRGESKKTVKITPNYKLSKSLNYVLYSLSVLEGSTELESMSFSVNPDLVVSGENISLVNMVNTYSKQIKCIGIDENIETLAKAVAEAAGGVDTDTNPYQYDILFACTNRGMNISGISLDEKGKDLKYAYGQKLDGGRNGVFGSHPFSTEEGVRSAYIKEAVSAFSGEYDTVIFNTDQYMIDAIVDANYPVEVKTAICNLAKFREDFMYFRDMGLNKTDMTGIESEYATYDLENDRIMFCAPYCQSYDIIDPYTKKQITVTIGYDLAQKLVAHCNNGRILPTAGIKYNMTIDSAIYGTLSFAPTICPEDPGFEGNQKEKLDDMHINYASYINNQLVIESLYTAQERNSQWSYINNVMGIQEVVKAIRKRCPVIRYTFIDGEDLERYKADIEEVIAPYQSYFNQLSIDFVSDTTYAANKIFYAALKVVYKDFVQTEWFKVTALSAVETSEA